MGPPASAEPRRRPRRRRPSRLARTAGRRSELITLRNNAGPARLRGKRRWPMVRPFKTRARLCGPSYRTWHIVLGISYLAYRTWRTTAWASDAETEQADECFFFRRAA